MNRAAANPIQELAEKLSGLISGGTLTIGPDTIDPSLAPLYAKYLQGRPLVISGARVSIPSGMDFVQILGTAAQHCEPFSNMDLVGRATWSSAGRRYELTLSGTSNESAWTLARSFAWFRPKDPGSGDPIWRTRIAKPKFVLSSTPLGLSFCGDVPFTSMTTGPLLGLFPGVSAVTVRGLVSKVDEHGRAMFDFSGEGPGSVPLAGLFTVTPALALAFGPPPEGGENKQQLYAKWQLKYDSQTPLAIYTAYPFDDPQLTFSADVAQSTGFIFGMLSKLTGGVDFGPMMPAQLPLPPHFGLSQWSVMVNGWDLSLGAFTLRASTTQPWPITAGVSLDQVGFTFRMSSTGNLTLILTATLYLDSAKDTALTLRATYPGFAFTGSLTSGGIDLHTLVAKYSQPAAQLIPDKLQLTELTLAVDPSSSVYRFGAVVGTEATDKWPINLVIATFYLENISLDFGSVAGAFEATGAARLALLDGHDAPTVAMTVEYKSKDGWTFSGEITSLTFEQLLGAMDRYFPALAGILRALGLDITVQKVAVRLRRGAHPGYSFTAEIVWTLDVGSDEPLVITGIIELESDTETQTGAITGYALYKTLLLKVRHEIRKGGKTEFWWSDFHATWDKPVATFEFGTLSMGSMVSKMVNAVVPGQDFSLVTPFDLLNGLTLSGVKVQLDFSKKTASVTIPTTLANFGFLKIQEFKFDIDWKEKKPPVSFKVSRGEFLGKGIDDHNKVGWDLLDPSRATPVPGMGGGVFRVDFLGLGQRFEPRAPLDTTNVETALTTLRAAFKETDPEKGGLKYSSKTNWIIAFEAWIYHDSIRVGGLFLDDPALYGVAVRVMPPPGRIAPFANLHFEILYKKLGNDIGVYQAAVTLPDNLRYLNFGPVGITLPNFAIEIYTNGDFRVDFGFPYNNNFSVSFAVQMLPFMGSGGFYFGALGPSTATNVPQRTQRGLPIEGNFGPVICVGLGVAVGLGGSLNYGIASGGLSLLLTGIVEGVFANFNPYDRAAQSKDFYWAITGKFGLMGRLFGVVDFAIVVARFDATITVSIAASMAAYQPVRFTFAATVSVSASIRLNLGLFSITIGFSFSLRVSDSYTIGSASAPPWDPRALTDPAARRRIGCSLSQPSRGDPWPMKWARVNSDERFTLWLVPHFTSASTPLEGVPGPAKAQIVVTTYIERAAAMSPTALSDFANLAQGALLWLVNSAVNGKPADKAAVLGMELDYDQARGIFSALGGDGSGAAFGMDVLEDFLAGYGLFKVAQRPKQNNESDTIVSVFPIVPSMTLQVLDGPVVPFSSVNRTSAKALEEIREVLMRMQPGSDGAGPTSSVTDDVSLSTFLFLDYFSLVARAVTQGAIDLLKSPAARYGDLPFSSFAGGEERLRAIVRLNRTRPLRPGAVLTIPETARIAPGTQYVVTEGTSQTLLGISRRFGASAEDLAQSNASIAIFPRDCEILLPIGDAMSARAIIDAMQAAGAFDNIAGQVARVFLQGLRPPWPTAGGNPRPLYEISGQQFDASSLKSGDFFTLAAPGTKWIEADDKVTLDAADEQMIHEMNGAVISPAFKSSVQPYGNTVARRFTLAAPVLWTTEDSVRFALGAACPRRAGAQTVQTLWQFPANLAQMLAADPQMRPRFALREETSDAPHLLPYEIGDAADPIAYSWATALSLEITRIPSSADPSTDLAATFNLLGTDTAGGAYLEQLLRIDAQQSAPIDQIYVLFPLEPGTALPAAGVKSDPLAGTSYFVMQTNLSTASNPPLGASVGATSATPPIGMSPIEMLRLVWECSVVRSGGYQLFYEHVGRGLPDFLFARDGTAQVTLLVTYRYEDARVRPFMNTVVVSQPVDPDSILYLEAVLEGEDVATTPLVDRAVTMTAGHVGFQALRDFPNPPMWLHGEALPHDGVAMLVEQQYQLLEYHVVGSPDFYDGPYGLPLSPLEPPASEQPPSGSIYAAVLPIARLAHDPGVDRGLEGQPVPADDPYRGIGKTVSIALQWHDLFGNVITTQPGLAAADAYTVDAPVLYFDDLIAVSAWPGFGLSYTIVRDEERKELRVAIASDSTRYDPANPQVEGGWLDLVATDHAKLAAIYYQIARNAQIALASTLDPKAKPADVTVPLVEFVVKVYSYLSRLMKERVYVPQENSITLTTAISDSNTAALFPLKVTLTVARTAHVDPSSGDDSATRRITTLVKPLFQPAGNPDVPGTLVGFANELQSAFRDLRVATSTLHSVAAVAEIYLVRIGGSGYSCHFSDPHYFTVRPLAVTPQSLANLAIHTYDGTAPLPDTPTTVRSFSNVDVDLLARNFLAAMDQFLTPDYVVNAWRIAASLPVTPNPVTTILDAKRDLAEAIPKGLLPPYKDQDNARANPFIGAAAQKLEQELLIRLSSAYQINSVMSVLATAGGPDRDPATAPRLYGKPVQVGTAVASESYTISNGSVPLSSAAGSSYLTFTFTARDAAKAAVVGLPALFDATHLEFDLQAMPPPMEGYTASSWLTFVTPLPPPSSSPPIDGSLVTLEIPIPLKAFPTSPALVSQEASGYPHQDGDVETTRLWKYSFAYNYAGAAQDDVHARVDFRAPPSARSSEEATLPSMLVQFASVWPAILADFNDYVLEPGKDDTRAGYAMQSFAWIAQQIAALWERGGRPLGDYAGDELSLEFMVTKQKVDVAGPPPGRSVLQTTVSAPRGFPAPVVDVEGFTATPQPDHEDVYIYTQGSGIATTYLGYEDALRMPHRTVQMAREDAEKSQVYDILTRQQAWGAIAIARNEFYNERAGSDAFIYRTPLARSVTPAVPLLEPRVTIDMAKYGPRPQVAPLFEYLSPFIRHLLTPIGGTAPQPATLQIAAAYRYRIGERVPLDVDVPILLTVPAALMPDSATVHEVATHITLWLQDHGRSGAPGTVLFSLSLFSDGATPLPLLKLDDIRLDARLIQPSLPT